MDITFQQIPTNGVQLHTALSGPPDGEPVILLHGFPEAWFGWESQIQALAGAGFQVIAPDQRGYNLSAKPTGVENYRIEALVGDILGLAGTLALDQFNLAGHDWGAMVAWNLAISHPQRVKRLAVANVPHPGVFARYLRTHPSQMLKSWYAAFFQLPALPEALCRAGNWRFLVQALPGDWNKERYNRYRTAWEQPGAITAMINWYRASFQIGRSQGAVQPIEPETLIIWGKKDPYLSWEMAERSLDHCRDGRLEIFGDATHWVQHDRAEEVSQLLIDHFHPE